MKSSTLRTRCLSAAGALILGTGAFVATASLEARQQPASDTCRVTGMVSGLGTPLPGVSITVRRGETVQSATSTDVDGSFRVPLADGTYQVSMELTGFVKVDREITVNKAATCDQQVDATLEMTPRTAAAAPSPGGRGAGPRGGGAGRTNGDTGFETLALNENAAAASLDLVALERANQTNELSTPSGFGSEALADASVFTGETARVDRGQLNERNNALNRGDFQLFEEGRQGGQFAAFGAQDGGNFQFQGGRGGRGGNQNQLGGRGVNQRRFQGQVQFSYSGSALNQAPLQLRSEVRGEERPNSRQQFNMSFGGPIKIPGIFENPNNSTNITVTYSGSRGASLYDQYATVPSDAIRRGDFSEIPFALIDPLTGQQFPGNIIPEERISEQAKALAAYYPAANLPGNTRNYHIQDTQGTPQNSFSFRLQHNFSGQSASGGNSGGRGGGGGGGNNNGGRGNQARSNAGQAGQGKRLLGVRTNVNMDLQIQYSDNDQVQRNVFSSLGGVRANKQLGINPGFRIQHGRIQQEFRVQFNKTENESRNNFTEFYSPAAEANIQGISDDPFAYGLPRLTFSSITGLSDVTPSRNNSDRFGANYSFRHPIGRNHQVRVGATFDWNRSIANTESNANGTFTYTGLYTSGGLAQNGAAGRLGFDYADFLLGMPQQATIQYGPGTTTLRGWTTGMFVEDEWRLRSNMTVNVGVRYDLLSPYIEEHGQLVNLDVTDDFTAAAPVVSGQSGAYSGEFPKSLIYGDRNNISPSVGLAWRAPGGLIVRPSWSMKFNNGNQFSSVARQLAQQPPFARTGTNIGTVQSALLMENALLGIPPNEVTNNYGIDENYVLGKVNNYNVDLQRPLGRTFQVAANYSHVRGSSLDVMRMPNRNPDGTIRIEGVQPFYWTSSGGNSELNSVSFQLRRNQVAGIGWQVQYTLAKSYDNAPSGTGGGAGQVGTNNVAQNDQDLGAEWGLSNFDRRHDVTASASIQLPWGQDRKWLNNGGTVAAIVGGWSTSVNFSWRSGQVSSVTVRGASRDIATGLSGALRANYNGEPLTVDNPSIDQWFNTSAFSIPATGTFGNSSRNLIVGPGSKNLNANIQRSVRLYNRNLNITMQISNILSLANYGSVDTNLNSPTFGQITSVSGNRTATFQIRYQF